MGKEAKHSAGTMVQARKNWSRPVSFRYSLAGKVQRDRTRLASERRTYPTDFQYYLD
jgi:hypothetical protein